mmetsp:Transcript_8669/g.18480  ORF Transcript_8669/g.18480 Transcript_8669/m.18480 type:complete len:208 (-) Transcript_8669:563-1186(-)
MRSPCVRQSPAGTSVSLVWVCCFSKRSTTDAPFTKVACAPFPMGLNQQRFSSLQIEAWRAKMPMPERKISGASSSSSSSSSLSSSLFSSLSSLSATSMEPITIVWSSGNLCLIFPMSWTSELRFAKWQQLALPFRPVILRSSFSFASTSFSAKLRCISFSAASTRSISACFSSMAAAVLPSKVLVVLTSQRAFSFSFSSRSSRTILS